MSFIQAKGNYSKILGIMHGNDSTFYTPQAANSFWGVYLLYDPFHSREDTSLNFAHVWLFKRHSITWLQTSFRTDALHINVRNQDVIIPSRHFTFCSKEVLLIAFIRFITLCHRIWGHYSLISSKLNFGVTCFRGWSERTERSHEMY